MTASPSYVVIVKDPEGQGEFRLPCATKAKAQLAVERTRAAFRRNGYPVLSYRIARWQR